jgi:uncharacterized protein YbjT (DUF2867 family)
MLLRMSGSAGRTALMAGATGLVGSACLRALLGRPEYARVVVLARRPVPVTHEKLETQIVDLTRPDRLRVVAADDAFCALGTTMAKAGSQEAFRSVDYLAVLAVADLALEGGARQFVLVSSVGADPASTNFYLQVKGQAEAAVAKRPFAAVHLLRPGLLLGDREERRPAESLARAAAPWFNPFLVGSLRQYRAVSAEAVGAAMVGAALEGVAGRRILHHDAIVRLAAAASGGDVSRAGHVTGTDRHERSDGAERDGPRS